MDHPLDPANRTLSHTSIQSSEALNVYSGTIALDENGEAWVNLPDWFEVLNKDFRYLVTPIGSEAELYIAKEVTNNKFKIAGGKAGMKVSWEISGVRHNPGFEPTPVDQLKPADQRGLYYNPEAYGKSIEKSIFSNNPEILEFLKLQRQNAGRLNPSN
jgi:hypothetical protein